MSPGFLCHWPVSFVTWTYCVNQWMSSGSSQVSCSNPFNTMLLLMSILRSFSRPYGCISKSTETKGNWSQLPPLSLWHTVSPHNTWAHSKHKLSTPCGNNKTQLITYKITWFLLCLCEGAWEWAVEENTLSCLSPCFCQRHLFCVVWLNGKVCRWCFRVIVGASSPHKCTDWTGDLHI